MYNRKRIIVISLLPVLGVVAALAFMQRGPVIPISQTLNIDQTSETYVSPISIDYLRSLTYSGSQISIEQTLPDGANYRQYIASYQSEGSKVFGLLTVPKAVKPTEGFPAIVFDHGFISLKDYKTTEKYVAYVDFLARSGFIVFKIDFRGHGKSEGTASGSYFSNTYTVDTINAVKSLQMYGDVDGNKVGVWGHSMAGNAVLRVALVLQDIKAVVIWAGAVYSYEDFRKYGINDASYVHRPDSGAGQADQVREISAEIQKIRDRSAEIDFTNTFWSSISLTKNLNYLSSPVLIMHATNDPVINIGYSRDLAKSLETAGKTYELVELAGGGHNIESPYFEQAMQKTVEFYEQHL